jgi:hypothetical protein
MFEADAIRRRKPSEHHRVTWPSVLSKIYGCLAGTRNHNVIAKVEQPIARTVNGQESHAH